MPALTLTADGVLLREIRAEDWIAAQALDADPEVTRYLSSLVTDEAGTRAYLDEVITASREEPRRRFELAITLPPADEMVGRVALHVQRPEHREALLWYVLRRDLWGRGIATAASRALVAFGFDELRLHRIWADADPRNTASLRLMEKLGFQREGQLRQNYWLRGEWCDSVVYGLLETER